MFLALRRTRQGDDKFKVNLGYSKFETSLSYMVGEGGEEGEMSLGIGVKAKELPQGIANEAPQGACAPPPPSDLKMKSRCGCGPWLFTWCSGGLAPSWRYRKMPPSPATLPSPLLPPSLPPYPYSDHTFQRSAEREVLYCRAFVLFPIYLEHSYPGGIT